MTSPDDISLRPVTPGKDLKLKEALSVLGPWPTVKVSSATRAVARSAMNGLCLPTEFYEKMNTDTLAKCLNSHTYLATCLHSFGLSEEDALTTIKRMSEAGTESDDWTDGNNLDDWAVECGKGIQKVGSLYNGTDTPAETETETAPTTGERDPDAVNNDSATEQDEQPAMNTITPGADQSAQINQIAQMLVSLTASQSASVDPDQVREIVKTELGNSLHGVIARLEIKTPSETKAIDGLAHKILPNVIKLASLDQHVMLVGPAGSGKTTLARQVAKALERPFFFNGAVASEYKLSGFIDAQGRLVRTPFREAWEQGGVYLFDEIDASVPAALMAFNAALANGHCDFPDGNIPRHENFVAIAAANTYGRGADRVYVGRNQLDGATLDRFAVLDMDYDTALERAIAQDDNWVDYVQSVRRAIDDLKIRHIVSPRASIQGAKCLAAGMDRDTVINAWIFKGLAADQVSKISEKMK